MPRLAIFVAAFLAFCASTQAHGPTPQKAEESVTIAASPDAVWAIVGDFQGIGAWHPLVKGVKGTGGNEAGAERTITLEKGDVTETLDQYDAAGRSYGYRLAKENVEALPVSFYTATITVTDAGGGKSNVVWGGRFYRGDTGNFPPDELNDEAAVAAMSDFFRRGLDGLKAKVEGK
jgi:mxaD protein